MEDLTNKITKKKDFTNQMIVNSKAFIADNNEGFEAFKESLNNFIQSPEMANLTPDEHSKKVLGFFQKEDVLRPEILLEKQNELSDLTFKSIEEVDSFREVLSQYQDDEQILLFNRQKGLEITDLVLDETKVMKFQNPNFVGDHDVSPSIKTAYQNYLAVNEDNEQSLLWNVENKLEETADFKPLIENPDLTQHQDYNVNVVFGNELPLNKDYSFKDLSLLKPTDKNLATLEKNQGVLNRKDFLDDLIFKRLSAYELSNDGKMFKDNKLMMTLEYSLFKKDVKRANLGNNPTPDSIVDGFLKVKSKNVLQFPYSPENIENFKQALEMIKEDDLFSLDKIKIGKKVDPRFKEALEQVKNAPQLVLGQDEELDKDLDNKLDNDDIDLDLDNSLDDVEINPEVALEEEQKALKQGKKPGIDDNQSQVNDVVLPQKTENTVVENEGEKLSAKEILTQDKEKALGFLKADIAKGEERMLQTQANKSKKKSKSKVRNELKQ